MKKRFISAIAAIAVFFSGAAYAREEKKSEGYTYLDRMFGYAAELYIDETLTKEEILDKALDKYLADHPEALSDMLKAGFSSIDDYTEYYSADELDSFVNDINHTFYGIGVIIQKKGDYIEVTNVLDDGGAKEAGILKGDLIYAVEGADMKGKSIDEVQAAITGELNTTVNITVLRGGEKISFDITRKPVNAATAGYSVIDDNVAYIYIINFAQGTAEEMERIFSELREKGIKNVILDLRNNPGGYLVSAVEIGGMTVPKGIIVQTLFRQSEENQTFYSELEDPYFSFAVLVNENTASAAEILTGAMQDSGVGKVIGETTFGKGVIQDIFNMRNNESFKITTGRYLTRAGREINGKGIVPDIEVLNTTEPIDVSKYPVLDYSASSSFGDEGKNIEAAKQRLSVLGYNIPGGERFDEDTEAAVLDFQIEHSLSPTACLDTVTMVQIENAFAKCEVTVDNQLYKAYEYFGGTKEKLDKFLNGDEE